MIEAVAWVVLGLTALVASLQAHRSRRARLVGRWAVALLFVVAGAGVNAWYLATGTDFAAFADASAIAFVRAGDEPRPRTSPRRSLLIRYSSPASALPRSEPDPDPVAAGTADARRDPCGP